MTQMQKTGYIRKKTRLGVSSPLDNRACISACRCLLPSSMICVKMLARMELPDLVIGIYSFRLRGILPLLSEGETTVAFQVIGEAED